MSPTPHVCALLCAGNTDALQLLGGLLSVLPERVSKTMEAHKDAITKKVGVRKRDRRTLIIRTCRR